MIERGSGNCSLAWDSHKLPSVYERGSVSVHFGPAEHALLCLAPTDLHYCGRSVRSERIPWGSSDVRRAGGLVWTTHSGVGQDTPLLKRRSGSGIPNWVGPRYTRSWWLTDGSIEAATSGTRG